MLHISFEYEEKSFDSSHTKSNGEPGDKNDSV